ncbi:MAG: hypothetical protein QNL61_07225 [Crocinitomicaceae bacterium]
MLISFVGLGQTLNATISVSVLYIGQPVTITYSVNTEKKDSLLFVPHKKTIKARILSKTGTLTTEGADFEITDKFIDKFVIDGKRKHWVGQYVVTTWDSGMYIIPGATILINDSVYQFQDLTIACMLVDPIDGVDLYDIKENFAEIPPKPFSLVDFLKSNWWWIALIIVGIIVFIIVKRRNKEDTEEREKPLSLRQRTLFAIDALEKAKLWEKGLLKEHFVELSMILRMYLTSRYEISLLEKTTYETRLLLTQKGLNEETVHVIARILSESDMVKFAKSEPDTISILRVSTLARQIVAETSPLEFDNIE